jgi:hypothetical protein
MFALFFRRNPRSTLPRSRFSLRRHSGRNRSSFLSLAHLVIMTSLEQTTNVEKCYTCAHAKARMDKRSHTKTPRRKGRKRHEFPDNDCIFVAVRRRPIRVNIKGCDQVAPPAGARKSVPQGNLMVAHYEVVGRVFQKRPVPQGTIDWLLTLARPYASPGLRVRSSLRDGAIFNAFSHHFVVGYYQRSLRD